MPTIVGYHDITKGQDHWLRSPKRKELFGPLGVTNVSKPVTRLRESHAARPLGN